MSADAIAAAVIGGDRRAAARLISRIEAGDDAVVPAVQALYRAGGHARIVGVTGPPGAGKSTLVDGLVARWRALGRSVAVLAIDPSSPLTGGAVLGDRVRMGQHAADPGVLIRSMGARGALGGLAEAAGDALTVLDAMRFDHVVVETVGIGQSEMDVLAHADVVLLLQTPQGGDGIQAVKAGVLEIADILLVNKSDAPEADRMIRNLREMVAHRTPTAEGWDTPVIATEANQGKGVDDVVAAIDGFFVSRAEHDGWPQRRSARLRLRLVALAQAILRKRIAGDAPAIEPIIAALAARDCDPHEAAMRIVDGVAAGR